MKRINRTYPAILITCLICLALMPGAYSYAADRNSCSADIAKFCGNIQPGTPAMIDCLETHESKLSPACKEYETTMMGKRVEQMERVKFFAKFKQTCSSDVARFCSNADPKRGGAVKCINAHANFISDACRETMKMIDVEQ